MGDARRHGFAADADAAAHTFVARLEDDLELAGDDGHHLARVLRLGPGEVVTAADGRGGWRPYAVVEASRTGVRMTATGPAVEEPELAPRLVVAFALTKGTKPELVVQKVTELGADALVPVRTQRSVARWSGPRADTATTRLRRIAREAAAQCRRARLVAVAAPADLGSLAGRAGLVVADRLGVTAAELPEPSGDEWVLVVGPEGGFDPTERAALGGAPALGVGPFVLRAETAAIAAVAALAGKRQTRSAFGSG
ncbi:MAG: RsmE family RNA methyltransferase [Acidimicrobiia bacterium]